MNPQSPLCLISLPKKRRNLGAFCSRNTHPKPVASHGLVDAQTNFHWRQVKQIPKGKKAVVSSLSCGTVQGAWYHSLQCLYHPRNQRELAYEICATCLAQWKHRSAQIMQRWVDRETGTQTYVQCVWDLFQVCGIHLYLFEHICCKGLQLEVWATNKRELSINLIQFNVTSWWRICTGEKSTFRYLPDFKSSIWKAPNLKLESAVENYYLYLCNCPLSHSTAFFFYSVSMETGAKRSVIQHRQLF